MKQPPIPPPLPRSQMNSVLSFRAGQHRERRVQSDAAQLAVQLLHARRREAQVASAELVELRQRLRPDDAVTTRIPRVPAAQPTYPPERGGCVDCRHTRRCHERGKDSPHADGCTSTGCRCAGYRRFWSWTDCFWLGLGVAVAIGALLFLVVTVAAI